MFIWNLYRSQSSNVCVHNGFSEACQIGKNVRQGCSLSPLLYVICDEAVMKEPTKMCRREYQ